MIESVFGVPWTVFLGVTVLLVGGCAFMAGQAAAAAWKPLAVALFQAALLGGADRLICNGLCDAPLASPAGYLGHTAVLVAITLAAYRLTLARRVTAQYPWLYARTGPFSWRELRPCAATAEAADTSVVTETLHSQ